VSLKSDGFHILRSEEGSKSGVMRAKSIQVNMIAAFRCGLALAGGLPFGTGADRTARTQSCPRLRAAPGDLYMLKLQGPASETHKNAVLVVCLLVMSVMCIGLIWQAQIIANQREDIKWLQTLKFGG
jgi:hypothetical protein